MKSGGVWAASTSASSGSPSSAGAPTSTSSTISDAVLVAHEVVDEQPHGVAEHDLVVALQQRDRDRGARRVMRSPRRGRRAPRPSRRRCVGRRARRGRAGCGCRARCRARGRRGSPRADRPPSVPTRSPRNRLFDAERNSGQPRAARRSCARSSSSDCGSVLPRSRPASTITRSRGMPAASAASARARRKPAHRVDDGLVVHRLGVGDAGADADVGGHHRRARGGRDRQVVGVGEPADVVAHDRAGAPAPPGAPTPARCPPTAARRSAP